MSYYISLIPVPLVIIYIFIFGLCVGSFLNVVIFRFGTKESPADGRSHCMHCGHMLAWYDNIPLFSWLILGGKCRHCGKRISIQYPIVEMMNALLWIFVYLKYGVSIETFLYSLMCSALIAVSFIDERFYRIPNSISIFIASLGLINFVYRLITRKDFLALIIGALSLSLFLFIIYLVTSGKGLGLGDVKLMAACGLVCGWKPLIPGFIIGCIAAVIIHSIRMRVSNRSNKLAFGSYLSFGVVVGIFVGEMIMNWYLGILGV